MVNMKIIIFFVHLLTFKFEQKGNRYTFRLPHITKGYFIVILQLQCHEIGLAANT